MTVVTYKRMNLFGTIENEVMNLSPKGKLVKKAWFDLPHHYSNIHLDEEEFVLLPNHVHGIVVITQTDLPGPQPALTEIMRAFKSFSARRINIQRSSPGFPVWQRSYYEHIIQKEDEWDRARKYILQNPQR
jgi:putative transposase